MTADDVFEPAKVTVAVGETVVWRNVGQGVFVSDHTVTAYEDRIPAEAEYFASGGFTSERASRDGYETDERGGLGGGAEYEHVFDVPGRYEYFCIPHESMMKGSIIVE